MGGSFYDQAPSPFSRISSGIETMPRDICNAVASPTSGTVNLTFFTPQVTYTATQVQICTGGTQAAATPTLCRMGFYIVDSSETLTLVCACASDTTLFNNTSTVFTRDFSTGGGLPASYTFQQGQRYAGAVITVSGSTVPSLHGSTSGTNALFALSPRLSATRTSQTDLPATITSGNLNQAVNRVWMGAL